jgi:hypothetical protein
MFCDRFAPQSLNCRVRSTHSAFKRRLERRSEAYVRPQDAVNNRLLWKGPCARRPLLLSARRPAASRVGATFQSSSVCYLSAQMQTSEKQEAVSDAVARLDPFTVGAIGILAADSPRATGRPDADSEELAADLRGLRRSDCIHLRPGSQRPLGDLIERSRRCADLESQDEGVDTRKASYY